LKLQGIVQSAVHIANKARAVGEKENKLAGVWNLSGNISGEDEIISAKKSAIRKTFAKHIKNYRLMFIGKGLLNTMRWVHESIRPLEVYPALRDIYELQDGVPTDEPLRTLFNDDSLASSTLSAINYKQGFYWINAVVNTDENDVRKAIDLLSNLFKDRNFEFRVTMTAVNPRTLILISNISFNKNEEEIKRAAEFCKLCYKELQNLGFYPYRSGSGMYDKLPSHNENTKSVIKQMKKVFDPNNIIAPGKYNI
jgi:4-cresol dehydrogenase (hydroxylating)